MTSGPRTLIGSTLLAIAIIVAGCSMVVGDCEAYSTSTRGSRSGLTCASDGAISANWAGAVIAGAGVFLLTAIIVIVVRDDRRGQVERSGRRRRRR